MRVAREDKGVDTQIGVFLNPCCHGRAITDQRRAGTTPHQTHASPQVGADFEVVAAAAVQGGHALLAY